MTRKVWEDYEMLRWCFLFLLLASSGGCMLLDGGFYGEPPVWSEPSNGCGVTPVNVNSSQTAEPELLRK